MSHDIKSHLTELLQVALSSVIGEAPDVLITLDRPKQATHGDFASNLAMQLARTQKRNPRELAALLVSEIPPSPLVEKIEIAGAGFINFYVHASAKLRIIETILAKGPAFGRSTLGQNRKLQLEFVSANPTGPLHVGHGRGAAYGASLSNLLSFAGWEVTREYYVNDAGRQMDILALSGWLRYLELMEVRVPFPPNAYQGQYVRDMAREMLIAHRQKFFREAEAILQNTPGLPSAERVDDEAKHQREIHLDALIANAKALLGGDWHYVHDHMLTEQLEDCRSDLAEFGVHFDVWFSEKSLFDTGMVERAVNTLDAAGHIYLQNGAKWFRSRTFGDEKDRVVQRENGLYTYFASDIAYHLNKYERGFDRIINVWGADHHGYIPRVKGAIRAEGLNPDQLDIALVQFAVLYRDGQKVSMSTRSGEFVTLRTLREEVGNDACRFFYVLRKSDQHLDFDLDLATSQTNENPVYYIQYAHARICSVLGQWDGEASTLKDANLTLLSSPYEYALTTKLSEFPEVIELAATDLSPHILAFYLKDLAGLFHSYYNAERVLVSDLALSEARVALITAVREVIGNGLGLLGVSAPQSM